MVADGLRGEEIDYMKMLRVTTIAAWIAFVWGCASPGPSLVLDPVGPPPFASSGAGSTGTLMVYSAFEQGADFNSPYYRQQYTDYKILSTDGKLLQAVHNDTGTILEAPKRIQLPVGTYRILAQANGYRRVMVPVVIRPQQLTTVHLEGSPAWPDRRELAKSNPVRLPDGEIAGWRASADTLSKP
jgi:hypothetical protein